jgi:hypothetical protein
MGHSAIPSPAFFSALCKSLSKTQFATCFGFAAPFAARSK